MHSTGSPPFSARASLGVEVTLETGAVGQQDAEEETGGGDQDPGAQGLDHPPRRRARSGVSLRGLARRSRDGPVPRPDFACMTCTRVHKIDTRPQRRRSRMQKARLSRDFMRVSDGTRTHDRLDHNQELYQLSYAHRGGVESTSAARNLGCRRQAGCLPRSELQW